MNKPSDENKNKYKEVRNTTRRIVRQAHQEFWDKFISVIENGIYGRQFIAYKFMENTEFTRKESEKTWIQHYEKLWGNKGNAYTQYEINGFNEDLNTTVDLLIMEELEAALRGLKIENHRVPME